MTVSTLLPLLPLVLPVVVTLVAGLLRQDGLPRPINEGITVGLVLAAAVLNALFNHTLTNNLELDFVVVAGYMASIIQLPQMQALQGYLQSNVLTVIKDVAALPVAAPAPPVSMKQPIPLVLPQTPRKGDNGG